MRLCLLHCIRISYALLEVVFKVSLFTFHKNSSVEPKIALRFFSDPIDIVDFRISYFQYVIPCSYRFLTLPFEAH